MEEIKPWYQSRTIWGALVAILAALAHGAGIELTAGDEARFVDLAITAAGVVGGILALYGRILARRRVG